MYFKMSSAICFNLDQSKILSSGNGLKNVSSDIASTWCIVLVRHNCEYAIIRFLLIALDD